MSITALKEHLKSEIAQTSAAGLYKSERPIVSPQSGEVTLSSGRKVLNFCANNYLGLANHPRVIAAASADLEKHGFGMASVRFICGTGSAHKELEENLAHFLGFEDCILFSSCFDANTGLFETILGAEDAIISDALNHASIIDGVRLCKARRLRYANNNLEELESCLKQSQDCRFRLIVTDGVFSMDGVIADLPGICDLAEHYDAMVMVDDSHAVGFLGPNGRGSVEHCKVEGRVHIVTGTLGKALGGASGGYVCACAPVVEWLRQRSRPYLFSNSLAPMIVSATMEVLSMLKNDGDALRSRLNANAKLFREKMTDLGYDLAGADHPIIPVMIYDAALASKMADQMLEMGIYVVGFSFPVVPREQARIRTQMSAAHSESDVLKAVDAFAKVGRDLNIIG